MLDYYAKLKKLGIDIKIKTINANLALQEKEACGWFISKVQDQIVMSWQSGIPCIKWIFGQIIQYGTYLKGISGIQFSGRVNSTHPELAHAVHQCARFCADLGPVMRSQ
eukprot:5265170-Ditylum_brightwellii.AAC.1